MYSLKPAQIIVILSLFVVYTAKFCSAQDLKLDSTNVTDNEIKLFGKVDIKDDDYMWVLLNYTNTDTHGWSPVKPISFASRGISVNWTSTLPFKRNKVVNKQIRIAIQICDLESHKNFEELVIEGITDILDARSIHIIEDIKIN